MIIGAAMPIFCLDGSIGCGKTTVLEYIHNTFGISIDLEPVQKWQPFLERLYLNQKGAFELQTRIWLDRCWIQEKPGANIVMERSPHFQRHVFVPIQRSNMREHEYQAIVEMYQRSDSMWSPQGYIYLRSDPRKCYKRIATRSRNSENKITLTYLTLLHDFHERAYMHAIAIGMPVICIDVDGAHGGGAGPKSVQAVATEVMSALRALGAI